ncbi:hypothetical protein AWC38_SpisGene17802 [Stylophora pistillata]|uniref:Integrase catalytic domain-containing protein n=1 Tax=Stylophora pistillata TaxID=50429 RepID=A0A2B4RJR2_STYPI|nr:hypothetical protein AWC38_SpisGene17802 [Stylophora pistillata]
MRMRRVMYGVSVQFNLENVRIDGINLNRMLHPIKGISLIAVHADDKTVFGYVCSQPCPTGYKLKAFTSHHAKDIIKILNKAVAVANNSRKKAGSSEERPDNFSQETNGTYIKAIVNNYYRPRDKPQSFTCREATCTKEASYHLDQRPTKEKEQEGNVHRVARGLKEKYSLICGTCIKRLTSIPRGLLLDTEIDLMDFRNCPCDCTEKHTWAMNITDHHTKYVYVTPLSAKPANEVLSGFKRYCYTYGFSKIILTYNGKEFANKKMETFYEENSIKVAHHSPRTPTTQGWVERSNRSWKEDTRALIMSTPSSSVTRNISYHRAIKMTPYEGVYGIKSHRECENHEEQPRK